MSANQRPVRQIKAVVVFILLVLVLIGITTSLSASAPSEDGAWGAGTLTEQNLHDLIAQMTVEEKDTFIHGGDAPCNDVYVSEWVQGCQGEAGRIPGIPTLGIPPLRLSDGPAGVRLGHVETAMPAPVGLTATFDPSLAYLFGAVVGRGQRATNQDVWLAPMMNMVNVPTAGRNFETLGEDPYLSSEMAVQLTLGAQSQGLIATLKHYVDNDFENGRNSTSVMIDEQTQREMELTSFEKAIKEGGAGAVMCSYNRINDVYACGNATVLNDILKGEWGWDGWVMSDWGATHTPQDLINGLDMEQPGSGNLGSPVINAIYLETYLTNTRTQLFADALSGDSNIKVDSVAGFVPDQIIVVDTDANAETRTIAAVGTAGTATTIAGGSASIFFGANAGSTSVLASSGEGFAVGQTVQISSGAGAEENTITAINPFFFGVFIDLATPLSLSHLGNVSIAYVVPARATNIKVNSVDNLNAGDMLVIDVDANQETVTITAVGTEGTDGTGVDITPALSMAHAGGAPVKDVSQPGTGIDLTAPLNSTHAAGTPVVAITLPAGATNIKVADTSGIYVGAELTIDTGVNQEFATVIAAGTSGPEGSGLTLAAPTQFPHEDGALVTTSGTGEVPATNDFPAEPAFSGEEWAAGLDDAVLRILTQMNKAGLLEGTQYGSQSNGCDRAAGIDCVPFVPQRPDLQAIQPDEFQKAQYIAERSATLLKNDSDLLPLTCEDLTTGDGVVLMGPTSISTYTGGGGSAHVRPYDTVESTYDALIEAATAKCGEGVMVSYVPGYDLNGPIVPPSALTAPGGEAGLLRQQITRDPVASGDEPVLAPGGAPDQVDPTVNYNWNNLLPANSAWRWTGVLTAPSDGSYTLGIYAAYQDSAELFVDGLSTINRRINMGSYPTYFPDSMTNSYATNTVANKLQDPDFQNGQRGTSNLTFSAGQQVFVDLRIVTGETTDTAIQFRWVPTTNDADQIAIAEAAAASANKTLYFAYNEGSEGSDRGGNAIGNGLLLAGNQDDVITAVAAASPNTVVVLNTGDPVFMPWESGVNTILQMWYPGQMGGPATADVVLGNVNPSGKSPVTFPDALAPIGQRFPQDTQPAPCADDSGGPGYYGQGGGELPGNPGNCPLYPGIYTPGFLGTNLHGFRTINYSDGELGGVMGNGIFQGYRWFDVNNYEPLFPFGHGLSYTTFEYRNLVLKANKDGTVRVSFIVQNKGDVAGAVVPQVYVGGANGIPAYAQQAVRALRGFDRVELRPHEAKRVEITLDARSFQYWDEVSHAWTFLGGARTIWVGDSSRDLRLSGTVMPMPMAQ